MDRTVRAPSCGLIRTDSRAAAADQVDQRMKIQCWLALLSLHVNCAVVSLRSVLPPLTPMHSPLLPFFTRYLPGALVLATKLHAWLSFEPMGAQSYWARRLPTAVLAPSTPRHLP